MKDLQNEIVIAGVAVVMMVLTYATFSGASENEAVVIEAVTDNSAMPEVIEDTEVHTVAKGDTVYSIARKHGLNPRTLMAINGCGKCDNLTVGQEIRLD